MIDVARRMGARTVRLMGTPIPKRFLDLPPTPLRPKIERVLFAGRLAPEKNLEAVVEAAERLPDLAFVIAGDGPLRGWLEDRAAELGNLTYVGWAKRRQMATGQQFPVFLTATALIVGLPVLMFLATGMPASLEHPNYVTEGPIFKRGFEQDVGLNIIPEFISLLLALSIYTAAYVAEIVRGGIQAVSHGQTEAAGALGLRRGPTLRLVVIPQAMRIIIPPTTNQYLNLTKNSSLATAIAYPDLVSVFAGTTLNQTGQAVEVILMTMAVYLTLSISISLVMNWYNARIALVER